MFDRWGGVLTKLAEVERAELTEQQLRDARAAAAAALPDAEPEADIEDPDYGF